MISQLSEKIRRQPIIGTLLLVAPIIGAITTFYNFGKIYDNLQLPRWAWFSELQSLKKDLAAQATQILELELNYRKNQIQLDQRSLRDAESQIQSLKDRRSAVPESLQQFKELVENSLQEHRDRVRVLQDILQKNE